MLSDVCVLIDTMKYKALISFAGKVSMYEGEIKEITDNEVVSDLLKAGYIERVKPEKRKTTRNTKTKEN